MTKAQMREAIDHAWRNLERMGYDRDVTPNVQRMTWDALELETKAEKEHRAMGRRFTDGAASYCLPIETTARLFVLQHAHEAATGKVKPPKSFVEAAGLSSRCLVSYAIGEAIRKARKVTQAFPDTRFLAIDYAKDVAQ